MGKAMNSWKRNSGLLLNFFVSRFGIGNCLKKNLPQQVRDRKMFEQSLTMKIFKEPYWFHPNKHYMIISVYIFSLLGLLAFYNLIYIQDARHGLMVGSQKGDIYSFSIITHEVRRGGPRSMPRSMYQGQRCFNLFTVGDFIPIFARPSEKQFDSMAMW